MATTDDLIIAIRADVTQLQKSLEGVNQQLVATQGASIATTQAMSTGFNQAANAALFLKTAIVAATAAATTLLVTTNNGVREFNSLANSLNLTYNQLARLRAVSEGANLETDMMIDLAKTLNEQIGEAANGNKDFEESFARLGLSMSDLTKLGVDEQLITVANALGQVSSQADKAQIGATLFGDNWLPALKLTEVNVKGLADEFDKLLPKINDLDVSRAIEADKEFDKLIANLRTTTEIISSELSPAFTVATRNLNALFNVDPGELNDNISFTTFASIELGAQLINILTAVSGVLKIVAASVGTLGNIIVMGVGVPVATIIDVYNTNVTVLTNLMIKAENVYNRLKNRPQIDPIPIGNKTAALDALMEKVKQTKATLEDFARTGIEDIAAGVGGTAGDNFRDEAIKEAMELKNKNKTGEPTAPKGAGDDGDADKKAKEKAAKQFEQLKEQAQKELNVILEKNMSEDQLEKKHYKEQSESLKAHLQDGTLTKSEYLSGIMALNDQADKKTTELMIAQHETEKAINDKNAEEDFAQHAARLEQLGILMDGVRQGGMTELEIMDAQHIEKMQKLTDIAAAEKDLQDVINGIKIEAEAQYQAKRLDLILGTGNKIQTMQRAFEKGNLQGALSFFAADFGGMSQHSRKMFELTKAARLADAALSIPSTVIEAARQGTKIGGWPLGLAMGGAALASQLGNLRAIQSASFGGGGSGGSSGGSGGGSSIPSSQGQQEQAPLQQRFVNIGLSGSDNTMYTKDSVRELIKRLNEEVKDGAVLRVN